MESLCLCAGSGVVPCVETNVKGCCGGPVALGRLVSLEGKQDCPVRMTRR
jgi:hypothetical protein